MFHFYIGNNQNKVTFTKIKSGFDPQISVIGMGLNNMRTRLAAFGSSIDIYSKQAKDTEVNIELDL